MNKKEEQTVTDKLNQIATLTHQLLKMECITDNTEIDAIFNNVVEDLELAYSQLIPNSQS